MTRRRAAPPPLARGFTLIEVLVALLILGIMSALGYGTYRAARISAERTEEALQRARSIEFGLRVIVMDFAQMAPRPVRDPLGQNATPGLPALKGSSGNGTSAGTAATGSSSGSLGASSEMHFNSGPGFNSNGSFGADSPKNSLPLAEFSRLGWSNTAGQQRSTLQRVSYALVDGTVKRSYTTALDPAQGATPVVQDLFDGVKTVQLRYLDGNSAWQNQWPATSAAVVTTSTGAAAAPIGDATRPIAVEITIEFKDWGTIRRLIEVAG